MPRTRSPPPCCQVVESKKVYQHDILFPENKANRDPETVGG